MFLCTRRTCSFLVLNGFGVGGMSKYQTHLKPMWDTYGWLNTLLIGYMISSTDEQRDALAVDIETITDKHPELRQYARAVGVPHILPDYAPPSP